jgi:hypothetical protein
MRKVQSMWFPKADCYVATSREEVAVDLLRMEREAADNTTNFRVGVCYCAPGQSNEVDFFKNEGCPAFHEFLSIMGDEIELFGHKGFRAQLSVTDPGKKSYYTKWRDLEIM